MKWCLWCGEELRMMRVDGYSQLRHQDGSLYKTFVGADGNVRDDHCVRPTYDRAAAERMAAERRREPR